MKLNPFHLVSKSPWPTLVSMYIMILAASGLLLMNSKNEFILYFTLSFLFLIAYGWWRDVHREAAWEGYHSKVVVNGLKMGMILFIISEVFFFASFFWGFFHSSVSPALEMGGIWPPLGFVLFNPLGVPLLNTLLLLSSGVTVTWCHHEILMSNRTYSKVSLGLTIVLGLLFTTMQGLEYLEASFAMSDSSFGSTFYMATGFHGLHVIIGSIFLMISFARLSKMFFSSKHLVGFECAAWYWHFVDVVWVFLYCFLYWWSF